ncbi:TPA: hypothetical protein OVC47_001563 [Staphylococcus aureus]|nr:hypothetical protein [Staphylococcus aureus]HEA0121264.1 hypothetical protein [Staphylococcus aureus]
MEVSDEIKKRLKKNNIPEKTYIKRRYKGEDIEEASTRPVQQKKLDKQTKEELEKRGIQYVTYWQRRNRGMSHEQAMTQPKQKRVKFTDEEKRIMKEHNVSESLARRRMRYSKWTREQVLTTPPRNK